jgi:hypothetical protein
MGDEELLITEHLNQAYASGNGMSNNNSTTCETLDMNGDPKTSTSNMASSLSSTLQMTNSLQTSNTSYNSSANQQLKESWNNPNQGHTSKPMNHINLSSQYTQFQVCSFFLLKKYFLIFSFYLEHQSSSSYVRSTTFHASTIQSTSTQ